MTQTQLLPGEVRVVKPSEIPPASHGMGSRGWASIAVQEFVKGKAPSVEVGYPLSALSAYRVLYAAAVRYELTEVVQVVMRSEQVFLVRK